MASRFTPCANYNEGWCRYGDKCQYGHDPIGGGVQKKKTEKNHSNTNNQNNNNKAVMVPFGVTKHNQHQQQPSANSFQAAISAYATTSAPATAHNTRPGSPIADVKPHPPTDRKRSASTFNAHSVPSAASTVKAALAIVTTSTAAAPQAALTSPTSAITTTTGASSASNAESGGGGGNGATNGASTSISSIWNPPVEPFNLQKINYPIDIAEETTGGDAGAGPGVFEDIVVYFPTEIDQRDYFRRVFSIVKRGIVNQVANERLPSSRGRRECVCHDDLYYMLTQVVLNSGHFARVLGVHHAAKIKSAARVLKDQLLLISRIHDAGSGARRVVANNKKNNVGSAALSTKSDDSEAEADVDAAAARRLGAGFKQCDTLLSMEEMLTSARHFLKYFFRERSDSFVKQPAATPIVLGIRAFIQLALKQLSSLHEQYIEHTEFRNSRVEKLHWPKLADEQLKGGGASAGSGGLPKSVSAEKLSSAAAATVFELKSLKLLGDSYTSVESMAKAGEAPAKITAGMNTVLSSLRNIVVNEENCEALGVAGACESISSLLSFFVINTGPYLGARIVELSLAVASSLALDEENRTKLGGSSEIAIRALRVYGMGQSEKMNVPPPSAAPAVEGVSDDRIAEAAMELIRNLSAGGHGENCAAMGRAFGCEAVVKAMKSYITFDRTSALGCAALRNLCLNNEENREKTVKAGGVEAIVGALRSHGESDQVAEAGCIAIRDLISLQPDLKEAFLRAGALEAVRGALRKHGFDDDSAKAFTLSDFSGRSVDFARRALAILTE